jgi:hypothetical protein
MLSNRRVYKGGGFGDFKSLFLEGWKENNVFKRELC